MAGGDLSKIGTAIEHILEALVRVSSIFILSEANFSIPFEHDSSLSTASAGVEDQVTRRKTLTTNSVLIMTALPQPSRCCKTCGQVHPHRPGMYSPDCVLIGGRTHARSGRRGSGDSYPSSDRLTTIPMPTNIREQAILFDQIWFWFIDMKHENDDARNMLSQYNVNKGTLRAAAPLLWLEWKRWDDLRGQTRNQENFDKAWQNFVHVVDECGRRMPVAWLTLRSMPSRSESPPLSPRTMPNFIMT